MKRIKLNINEITEFDLNLAKSERAISAVDEIVKLSIEERTQKLNALKEKIKEGGTDLFEEKVLAKLLENRTAERIKVIHKNLSDIEKELKNRKTSPSSTVKRSPPPSSSPTKQTVRPSEYRSELLEFLATQKPPTPPEKPSSNQRSNVVVLSTPKKQPSRYVKDVLVGIIGVIVLVVAFWYVVFSEESQMAITTFDQQATVESSASGLSKETLQQIQAQFDGAIQELRFGEFEQGKTQLLNLIQKYPTTPHAENAYIAIADTYRQRQNNPDEALRHYQTFMEKYPESSHVGRVQLKMGFSYEDMEDISSAEDMYRLILNSHGEKSRLGQLANERLQSLTTQ